jgi:hypothetical protein
MAFLDNSGDIILDAVLTDTGRKRMAQGTFNISQFALGDDEIDYSLYNKNAVNSAYYDLNILQTPILESFTNNASSLKSRLLTNVNPNLLFLPIFKLYNNIAGSTFAPNPQTGLHIVAVDETTEQAIFADSSINTIGIMKGVNPNNNQIRIDQGTDSTSEPSAGYRIDDDLLENQFIVEMDSRFGKILDPSNNTFSESYVDDDYMASYFITGAPFVSSIQEKTTTESADITVLNGKRGNMLMLKIRSGTDLQTNNYLFDTLGGNNFTLGSLSNLKFIDTIVRITGVVTGCRIDVPVRFVKV